MESEIPKIHPVEKYVNDVLSGEILTCELHRLSVERYVDDLENGYRRGIWFDEEEGQRYLDFFPTILRHTIGDKAGQPFELEPWQQFIIFNVFGWKREDGSRRFREVYEQIPRKNGKSTRLGGIGLAGLVIDGEPGAEVYSAATKKDQARIVHAEAARMRDKSPSLRAHVQKVRDNLSVLETFSKFEPLSSDEDSLDGLNIHMGLIDELHAHKTRAVYDVLSTATGSRRQPLIYSITTAGFAWTGSICVEQRDYGIKILKKVIEDDSFFVFITTIDEGDDWQDERNWFKANPNLGVSVKIEDLRRKALKAKETPASLNNFLCKHLNVWTTQISRWISPEQWDRCKTDYSETDLDGAACYAGLDLSSTMDITALSLVFPIPGEESSRYRVLNYYWIPKETVELRSRRDQVLYKEWVRRGVIFETPGSVVDYDFIKEKIIELGKRFNIREIAIDRWNAIQLAIQLEQTNGFKIVLFGQGFASMSAPTKELEAAIVSQRLEHNGDPVLSWMISNVSIRQDAAGNLKIDKATSGDKVDGAVSLVMAIGRATAGNDPTSVYETRGVLTL